MKKKNIRGLWHLKRSLYCSLNLTQVSSFWLFQENILRAAPFAIRDVWEYALLADMLFVERMFQNTVSRTFLLLGDDWEYAPRADAFAWGRLKIRSPCRCFCLTYVWEYDLREDAFAWWMFENTLYRKMRFLDRCLRIRSPGRCLCFIDVWEYCLRTDPVARKDVWEYGLRQILLLEWIFVKFALQANAFVWEYGLWTDPVARWLL